VPSSSFPNQITRHDWRRARYFDPEAPFDMQPQVSNSYGHCTGMINWQNRYEDRCRSRLRQQKFGLICIDAKRTCLARYLINTARIADRCIRLVLQHHVSSFSALQ
jgi:hypothetical protein